MVHPWHALQIVSLGICIKSTTRRALACRRQGGPQQNPAPMLGLTLVHASQLRAENSTLPPSWLPDAEWADSLEESLLTAGFPVNVVTLGMWLAPATEANGVTQLLVQLPVEAPVTTAVEAVVQVTGAAFKPRVLEPILAGRA